MAISQPLRGFTRGATTLARDSERSMPRNHGTGILERVVHVLEHAVASPTSDFRNLSIAELSCSVFGCSRTTEHLPTAVGVAREKPPFKEEPCVVMSSATPEPVNDPFGSIGPIPFNSVRTELHPNP